MPATVMVILRYLLQRVVSSAPGSQVALIGPANRGSVERGVLIWLYHASPALNLQRAGGDGIGDSGVNIDLDVLLTCVGDERRYEPARLLGACVAALEAHPILRAATAREALAAIDGHGLASERIMQGWVDLPLALHSVGLAELAHLWGAGGAKGLSVACRIQSVPCGRTRGSA